MFEIFNEYYYIDLDKLYETVKMNDEPTKEVTTNEEGIEVIDITSEQLNAVKYEFYKFLVEVIFTEKDDDVDEHIGMHNSSLSLGYRMSFNTLLNDGIIKKK